MKELLIKIKAFFEGNGLQQASSELDKIADSADRAKSGASGLGGAMQDPATKAGVWAGATSALSSSLLDLGMNAITSVASKAKELAVAFGEGVMKASNFAGAMNDLSARTGAPIQDLVVLQEAFKNAGLSADSVGPMINRLQKALSGVNEQGEPTAKVFERIGLSVTQLQTMSPQQAFEAIAAAIMKLPTAAEQAAASMEIFGRSGGQMLAIFKDAGAFTTAATQVGQLAENTAKAAQSLDTFSDAMESIETKKMQFFMGAAAQFATDLERAGVAIQQIDLSGLGEEVGLVVRGAIEVGKYISEWVTYLKQFTDALGATGVVVDTLKAGFQQLFDPFGITKFIDALRAIGASAVEADANLQNVAGTTAAVGTAATATQGQLQGALDTAGKLQTTATDAGQAAIQGAGQQAQTTINTAGQQAQTGIQTTAQQGQQAITLTAQQIQQAAQQLATAFQQGLGQDISPALQALVTALQTNLQQLAVSIQTTSQTIATTSQQSAQQIQQSIQTLATSLQTSTQTTASTLQTSVPQITQAVSQLATSIQTALSQSQTSITTAMPQIQQALTTFQTSITQSFTQLSTTFATAATSIQTSIQSANIQGNIQMIVTAVQSGFSALQASLSSASASIQQAAAALQSGNQQLSQGIASLARAASENNSRIGQVIAQGITSIGNAAANNDRMLAQSISNVASALANAVQGLQSQINALASRR